MTLRLTVLGVSTFARALIDYVRANAKAEIIAVDADEGVIGDIADVVDRALIGNATHMGLLEELDLAAADRVLVAVGSIEASLLTLLNLRALGVKHVTVEAVSGPHFQLLELLNVDEILFPERQMAAVYGLRLLHPGLHGARALSETISLVTVSVPDSLAGRTIGMIESEFDVAVVSLLPGGQPEVRKPEVEQTVAEGDLLVLTGTNDAVAELEKTLGTSGPFGSLLPW